MSAQNDDSAGQDTVGRPVKILVAALLGLLVAAGIGLEAWPLTGWRLFSAIRDETQTNWVIETVDQNGTARIVDFDELPFAYSEAAWPLATLPDASPERREAVCQALLKPVRDIEPAVADLRLVRDDARLVQQDGTWTVVSDLDVLHTCTAGGASS